MAVAKPRPQPSTRASEHGSPVLTGPMGQGGKRRQAQRFITVEPLLLHPKYSVPRWGFWKRVESKAHTTGIALKAPLSFTSVKYVYEVSHLINSLYWLSHYVESRNDLRDAVSLFHSVNSHLRRKCEWKGKGVIDTYLSLAAINLRSAKSRLSRAGNGSQIHPLAGEPRLMS